MAEEMEIIIKEDPETQTKSTTLLDNWVESEFHTYESAYKTIQVGKYKVMITIEREKE